MSTGAEIALEFYAGHGMEMNGGNHLVPVDARRSSAAAVALDDVLTFAPGPSELWPPRRVPWSPSLDRVRMGERQMKKVGAIMGGVILGTLLGSPEVAATEGEQQSQQEQSQQEQNQQEQNQQEQEQNQQERQNPREQQNLREQGSVESRPFAGGTKFGFDPTVIQPGSHVFFADDADPGEIAPFKNGAIAVDLQLFGGDIVYYFHDGDIRLGTNSGLGITQLDNAAVLLGSLSGFVQIGSYYRIDAGYIFARSAKEGTDATTRDRSAWFVGVSFPTQLNEALKRLLKSD